MHIRESFLVARVLDGLCVSPSKASINACTPVFGVFCWSFRSVLCKYRILSLSGTTAVYKYSSVCCQFCGCKTCIALMEIINSITNEEDFGETIKCTEVLDI